MSLLKQYGTTVAGALQALAAVTLVMFCVGATDAAIRGDSVVSVATAAFLVCMYTFLVGAVLVVIYGAPVYLLLARRRIAGWATVAMAGVLPGAALLMSTLSLGAWAMACGAAVALLTHAFLREKPAAAVERA